MRSGHSVKTTILVLGDYATLYGSLILVLVLRYQGHVDPPIRAHYIPFAIIFGLWLIAFAAFGFYDLRFMKTGREFLLRLIRVMIANVILAILFFYLVPFFEIEPRRNLVFIAATGTAAVFLWRILFYTIVVRAPASRVLFLGVNKETTDLASFLLARPQLGYRPTTFGILAGNGAPHLPLPETAKPAVPTVVVSERLADTIRTFNVDTIVITRELKENRSFVRELFEAIPLGVSVVEFTAFHEMITGKVPMSLIEEIWFLENLVGTRKRLYEFFKRILDILLSILMGIPALLLTPIIILSIKLDSSGSAFFTQKRVGRNGRVFTLIKFRSMIPGAETTSGFKGIGRDPRHTRVGAFLRKNYLDELPQIWNVLKGDMSFIGPRPERPKYVEELKKKIAFYEMRLLVPPGLTGWAQIHMEDDASVEDAPEKMQYDLYYIKNRSFTLDLLIALRTLFILLQRNGR